MTTNTQEKRTNPWYVLGHELPHALTIDEALELVKANDDVQPANLYTIDNDSRYFIDYDGSGKREEFIRVSDLEEVPDFVGVKSDIYGTMSTQSPNYEIMQRREALELAYMISGLSSGEAVVKAVGNVGHKAQKFFAYLELPELVIDPNGIADTINRGLYVATSFAGNMATTLGESDIRIACTNQLTMTLRKLQRAIKVHHRAGAEQRIMEAAKALQYAGAVEQERIKAVEKMMRVDGSKAMAAVTDHFWDISDPDLPANTRTRRENYRESVWQLYKHGEHNVQAVGENGWAAYNAFTEYQDHYRPLRRVNGNAALKRAEGAVLPGSVVNEKAKASDLILALAA